MVELKLHPRLGVLSMMHEIADCNNEIVTDYVTFSQGQLKTIALAMLEGHREILDAVYAEEGLTLFEP